MRSGTNPIPETFELKRPFAQNKRTLSDFVRGPASDRFAGD
jgi:hypothetical protein